MLNVTIYGFSTERCLLMCPKTVLTGECTGHVEKTWTWTWTRLVFELFLHCSNIHSRSDKTHKFPLLSSKTYTLSLSLSLLLLWDSLCCFHFSIYLESVPTENYQPLIFRQRRRLGSAVSYLRVHFRMMTFKVFQSGITVGKLMQILVLGKVFTLSNATLYTTCKQHRCLRDAESTKAIKTHPIRSIGSEAGLSHTE